MPLRHFGCSICRVEAPKALLLHSKFAERMSWLRRHYKAKHPVEFRRMYEKNPVLAALGTGVGFGVGMAVGTKVMGKFVKNPGKGKFMKNPKARYFYEVSFQDKAGGIYYEKVLASSRAEAIKRIQGEVIPGFIKWQARRLFPRAAKSGRPTIR